jgi:hypothetical protein
MSHETSASAESLGPCSKLLLKQLIIAAARDDMCEDHRSAPSQSSMRNGDGERVRESERAIDLVRCLRGAAGLGGTMCGPATAS